MGRTECNRVVNFVGDPQFIGQLADVIITETRTYTLRGELPIQTPNGAVTATPLRSD